MAKAKKATKKVKKKTGKKVKKKSKKIKNHKSKLPKAQSLERPEKEMTKTRKYAGKANYLSDHPIYSGLIILVAGLINVFILKFVLKLFGFDTAYKTIIWFVIILTGIHLIPKITHMLGYHIRNLSVVSTIGAIAAYFVFLIKYVGASALESLLIYVAMFTVTFIVIFVGTIIIGLILVEYEIRKMK